MRQPFRFSLFTPFLIIAAASAASAAPDDRLDRGLRTVTADSRPLEAAARLGHEVRDGRLQVVITVADGRSASLAAELEARGAVFVLEAAGRVQAFVPLDLLAELARHPDVLYVERPLYAELPEPGLRAAEDRLKLLAVTSEGVAEMNVAAWHSAGFTGQGVKVGVIDLEFGGWEDLLGVELPAAPDTTFRAFGGAQSGDDQVHGTACAEIVHDVAPDAKLYLAEIRTTGDLFAALDWLASEGVTVVTMSVGFFGAGPGDGSGSLNDAITTFAVAADALFITSAGNERRSHWQGASVDADGNGWVDFSPGDDLNELSFSMSSGDRVAVNLVWNDWSSPTSDYSLHLFRLDGGEPQEVASSDRPQGGQGWQTPVEQVSHTAPDGGTFGVRIDRTGVAGQHDLELFSLDSDLVDRVGDGSITIPGDTAAAMAVAAVSYNSPYRFRNFSSAGPANGPGGSLTGGAVKPDLSGFDGVSTVSYGTRAFFGTSAASPHVAGAAALVRGADPALDFAAARSFLEARAPDLGPGGKDNDYGWGRVFLGQVPGASCSYVVDPTAVAAPAAGGLGLIRVTADDGCPWTAASLDDWIAVAPASGSGTGSVGYVADANDGSTSREGELLIAGVTVLVSQPADGCAFQLSPTGQSFSAGGGNGLFSVQTEAGCAWEATPGSAWIEVSQGSGTGNGTVVYTVAAHQGTESRTGSITVVDQLFTVTQAAVQSQGLQMVAGIAETEGLGSTRWRSDVAIHNPTGTDAVVELDYRHDGGAASGTVTVAPGGLVVLADAAGDFFGVPDSVGAVEVFSNTDVVVTARTFNDAPNGTFGQFLPGVTAQDGLTDGRVGVLSQLRSSATFRTNIGFVDLSGAGAVARIRLFDGAGLPVGTPLQVAVDPRRMSQENRVFRTAGAGDCTGCYALVDVVGGQGSVWAYASVIDRDSGDPTTVPLTVLGSAAGGNERSLVAGVAEIEGANQTRWRSNVAVLNLSGETGIANLHYRYGEGDVDTTVTLLEGELLELEDAAGVFFGRPDSAGAVEVASSVPLIVTARTFNDSPEGTFGQFLPGLGAAQVLAAGATGIISQLASTADVRTNIGFTNYSGADCRVRTRLYDAAGVQLAIRGFDVPAGGWLQENRIFEVSGAGPVPAGYVTVEVVTDGCLVWAYGSVVDNGSGDPTTVPVVVR